MYSINGILYEGTGMSGYKVRNGITIYVRFTLSYGKDIGGYDSTGGGYGSLSSYCGLWINGGYQALGHDFVETDRLEPTETEDGYIHYRCSKCHEGENRYSPGHRRYGAIPHRRTGRPPPCSCGGDRALPLIKTNSIEPGRQQHEKSNTNISGTSLCAASAPNGGLCGSTAFFGKTDRTECGGNVRSGRQEG